MANIPRPNLTKIPGGGMPLAKQENHAKDLTKLTRAELLEMKEREAKLLANIRKLQSLPDKGKRIQDLYDKIQTELEQRDSLDEAAALFSELNIAAKGQQVLNQLEWSGRLNDKTAFELEDPTEDLLDSDDETEMDPLRVVAQRTMHERRVIVLPPEPELITAADLEDIKSFKTDTPDSGLSVDVEQEDHSTSISNTSDSPAAVDADIVAIAVTQKLDKLAEKSHRNASSTVSSDSIGHHDIDVQPNLDQHVHYLVQKTELQASEQREKFKPYKTTISNVHDPDNERVRKKGKHWENTAATPPLIQHSGTKMLTLLDSVHIQSNYLSKLKDLQEKQAAERLVTRMERLTQHKIQLPSNEELKTKTAFTAYRVPVAHIEGELRLNEDEQVHDPLDEDKPGGGITYTVYN